MTTESNDNDLHVANAYRELASETTPPELDRKVLSMAADSARARGGIARAWIRPMAWAATIGLSLAVVLEITQLPDSASPPAVTDAVETLEKSDDRDEAPSPTMNDLRMQQESAKRSDAPAAATASSPPVVTEPEPARDNVSVSTDFEADDMSLLREAEEQARARSGSESPESAVAGAAAFAEKKERVQHCDADARSAAQAWYTCILELRERGLAMGADEELTALLIKYPDFEVPDANPDGDR